MQLVECYLPLLRFIAKTRAATDLGFEDYRQQVCQHITDAISASSHVVNHEDDIHHACFAIIAWVDEMVLRSALDLRHQWRDRLLQTEYYHTELAGEVFFSRMDALEEDNYSTRLVYLTCLLLGFQGKYHHLEHDELKARISQSREIFPPAWREVGSSAEITPFSPQPNSQRFNQKFAKRSLPIFFLIGLWILITMLLGMVN